MVCRSGADDDNYHVMIVSVVKLMVSLASTEYFSVQRAPSISEQRLTESIVDKKYAE